MYGDTQVYAVCRAATCLGVGPWQNSAKAQCEQSVDGPPMGAPHPGVPPSQSRRCPWGTRAEGGGG